MNIRIIGTGAMGANHMRVVQAIPELHLAAAMDASPQRLAEACRAYPEVRPCIALAELAEAVDAVVVAVPTEHHHAVGTFFLERGKHVLMEKPIALTLDEADDLIAVARRNGVCLAVGHLERFNPAVEYVERWVERPRFMEIQRLGSFSPRSLDIDVILDLMIHDLDILLHWERSPLQEIRAVGVPIISSKIDIANVRLQFASGLVANLTASRVSREKIRKLRIFQESRYISVDYQTRQVKMCELQERQIVEQQPVIPTVEPLRSLWLRFHRTILGEPCSVSGEAARAALDLALRISADIAAH